jgi:hypothetical protein
MLFLLWLPTDQFQNEESTVEDWKDTYQTNGMSSIDILLLILS